MQYIRRYAREELLLEMRQSGPLVYKETSAMTIGAGIFALGLGLLIAHVDKPLLLILPVLGLPSLLLFWHRPILAIYALILLMPFEGYSLDLGFMYLSGVNALIIVLSVIMLFKLESSRRNLSSAWVALILILLLLIVISTITSEVQTGSFRFVVTRTGSVLTFLLVFVIVDNYLEIRRCLFLVLAGALFTSIVVILASTDLAPLMKDYIGPIRSHGASSVGGFHTPTVRSSATFGTYVSFGVWVELVFPFLLISAITKGGLIQNRLLALVSMVFISVAVFLAQSRSTWLALVASISCALFLLVKKRRLKFAIVTFSVPLFLFAYNCTVQLIILIRDMRIDTVYNRLSQYKYALHLFLESPIFGLGRDGFTRVFFNDFLIHKTLHNNFLAVLIAHGITAFIPYLALIFISFYFLYNLVFRVKNNEFRLLACGLFAGLFGILVEIQFAEYLAGKGLWLMMALACRSYLVWQRLEVNN